jgi:predicted ribosome quality control (RQC) complex YloA/Tae2 family protein
VHNNYYFLRPLSHALDALMRGTVISECFSQNKDELIIRFETMTEPFFIKASLEPAFSCLAFPANFHRARKNSVDLFPILIGQRVASVRCVENERSIALALSNNLTLLFKMHANRSNVLLFEHNAVIALFRNNLAADEGLDLSTIDRTIDWSYEAFIQHQANPGALYFTFGKVTWKYLAQQGFDTQPPAVRWQMIQDVRALLDKPVYRIAEANGTVYLSLLPVPAVVREFTDPLEAINEFFYTYTHQAAFVRERQAAIASLREKLKGSENYYQKTFEKLAEVERDTNYKTWADLIMAYMHTLHPGQETVTLPDFYNDQNTVTIKLKKDLSPQKNAEAFYRKAKNQHIEIQRLQQSLETKEKEMAGLRQEIATLEASTDLKTVRAEVGRNPVFAVKEKQPVPLPYHEFIYHGFKIWVGKNAQSNDTLTLRYGYKEDLWLHAKDVPGSHVLIKHQANKPFPKDVIERAAELAAYNSKRKTETLCPVVVTPRKYVRKRKGDPAGAVVVEREEVILVVPRLEGEH